MRLIIKEYIAQLKEKDELDLLLCDLLMQNGYIADNVPKTGNRQYGVDIQLHNRTELLLLVIKQGNIDRKMWDGDINSVRQSIEEIKDVYFTMLTEPEKAKKIRIIVATNGVKEESIRANWSGYVNSNKVWNGKDIHIEFWGIDDIVDMIQKDFLNEYLFDKEQQSLLRKALYFVEESDYKRKYFENVIDGLCKKMYDASNDKEYKKCVTSLFLASQMMCQYAVNNAVVTIAIMISEYLLIKYWKYLLRKEYLGKKKYIEWLIKFCQCYDKWNGMYYAKMKKICADKTLFPNYNIVENRVMLYEILGYLTTYANFLVPYDKERAGDILTSIVLLINNNPQFVYAPYDRHVGIMVAVYRLLAKFERYEEINILLKRQTMELMLHVAYMYDWRICL